jgi:zinc/manganese transport system substrate-binding protein
MRISSLNARALIGLAVGAAVALTGCSTATPSASPGSGSSQVIAVAAAESFWGSIASQLGGDHVKVTNIISKPDADPHDYEPTAADARVVATAKYVIVNGIGYDAWASKMLDANPVDGRTALVVGEVVGVKEGGNPHRWYSPDDVHKVIAQITADYKKIAPADAAYFDTKKQEFETTGLAKYNQLVIGIKYKYTGIPIGGSESIVTLLAEGLGLKVLTPQSFMNTISEGGDPSAADKATVDAQIKGKLFKVYVYNSQNATPDVQAQVDAAKAAGIEVTTVTETPTPPDATFQAWQVSQLEALAASLDRATGK